MSNIKEERRKKEYNDLYKELCRRYDGETADQLRKYHNSVNRQDVCSRSTKPETVTAKRSSSYKNPESAFSKKSSVLTTAFCGCPMFSDILPRSRRYSKRAELIGLLHRR